MYYLLSYRTLRLLSRGSLSLGGLLGARGSLDLRDLQTGQLLAMTLQTTIALALVELEDKLLLTLELLDDLSSDLSFRKLGRIGDDLLAVVQEDDGKLDLGADLALDLLDVQEVIGGDLILLAAGCNDCVHFFALHASVSATVEHPNRRFFVRQQRVAENALLIHKDGTDETEMGAEVASSARRGLKRDPSASSTYWAVRQTA